MQIIRHRPEQFMITQAAFCLRSSASPDFSCALFKTKLTKNNYCLTFRVAPGGPIQDAEPFVQAKSVANTVGETDSAVNGSRSDS